MDKKIVVVVIDRNQYGDPQVAGAWLSDKPNPEAAIKRAAKLRDVEVDGDGGYKETFRPQVFELRPELLGDL